MSCISKAICLLIQFNLLKIAHYYNEEIRFSIAHIVIFYE